ncbi:hypothetical protein [Paracoccus sp. (in: a-proteobacteria)]|uniref:hypothetical protein n=1 Tax=Paracoccus sp. TaxID=267 RepID=UPI0026E113A9|nr:hypothetical protein [Paracoccus sp. (in: a-proteobacteria)]MDO5371217.1 hypothetical protein [Paracoccus sp. (in: a-proteobacteria)]
MPELIRLYIRNIVFGFLLAVAFTAALVGLDVANLRHLTLETTGGWLALAMLAIFNTLVFAGVQFAIAVMRMAEPEQPPRGGGRAPVTPPQPAVVRIAAPSRRP